MSQDVFVWPNHSQLRASNMCILYFYYVIAGDTHSVDDDKHVLVYAWTGGKRVERPSANSEQSETLAQLTV